MSIKIKFDRLDYQEKAVNSISEVFANIKFIANENRKSNPSFNLNYSRGKLAQNIENIREENRVDIGDVSIMGELVIDTLMETGTGKTFTFLESIYRLNRDYGLSKFIILVPSNPIRQGTLKNIEITKEFFVKAYNGKSISAFNYNEKTVQNYINASDMNISVLIATYQSFNSATNKINKKGVEQSLIGRAKSYMEAIAYLNPVIIIDEPHRFEGKQTAKYLKLFNPLFTLRFGATYKNDEYQNLIYTLDSVDAFSQGLVKAITVDTVRNESMDNHSISYIKVTGANQKEYVVTIEYKDINAKTKSIKLKKGDNLGVEADIEYLKSYIIEKITKKEILFLNGISLPFEQSESYGVLLDVMQTQIVNTAIQNHFEREEELFKMDIKSLCLFFIDRVDKYLLNDGKAGDLAKLFEKLYLKNLNEVLKKDNLDKKYKKYLLKTKDNLKELHSGYFAKSKSIKDEEEAIELILNKKEELLSFDTNLRFIFSQWALQEGWDNPNVMTLCKLAPSNSKISKLQQIGRGLRLAVTQDGKRVTKEHNDFDFINELFVVVPSTESDFVSSIQNEISSHSVRQVAKLFNETIMIGNGISSNPRFAVRLLDKLEELKYISIDDEGVSEIVISKKEYNLKSKELEYLDIKGCDCQRLKEYFDSYFKTTSRIKAKDRNSKKDKNKIKIDREKFLKFKNLWDTLNYDAVVKYDINSVELIEKSVENIDINFVINSQDIIIQRDRHIEDRTNHDTQQDTVKVKSYTIFTIYEFIKTLSNNTKLTVQTIATILNKIKKNRFEQIAQNENLALKIITDELISAIYDIIINKISYDIKIVEVKNTSLTNDGMVKEFINIGSLGRDRHNITKNSVLEKSIYDEKFMEIDSEIEGITIDESTHKKITVFAKLPKVHIPTAHGRSYNPDFGYVVEQDGQKELYFIVETKGYEKLDDISTKEKLQIASAKAFFEELKKQGIDVVYKTKLNNDKLVQMVSDIQKL